MKLFEHRNARDRAIEAARVWLAGLFVLASAASTAASSIELQVVDEGGAPTTFSVVVYDLLNDRFYPLASDRVQPGPDMPFQAQVYRETGDRIAVPPGSYFVRVHRGPEYHRHVQIIEVVDGEPSRIEHELRRWAWPFTRGYYSGDHHFHGAGCSIRVPGGVRPVDLVPHLMGEGLNVGQGLVWAADFAPQSGHFSRRPDPASTPEHLLKVDLETSLFASSQQGHNVVIGLSDIVYPGTIAGSTAGWPHWAYPILHWAKGQGGVTGSAHSSDGLRVASLPSYEIPSGVGGGALEFFVNVTQQAEGPNGQPVPAVDFFALGDTDHVSELNAWYHIQNTGFRPRISGESDFPCISKTIGSGRSYVKIPGGISQANGYREWLAGVEAGRGYVSTGGSHLYDFTVDGVEVGTNGSEVRLGAPGWVGVQATATCWLDPAPGEPVVGQAWDIEYARIGGTRQANLEIVVNGVPVRRIPVECDGRAVALDEAVRVNRSSWIALRILGSSHTNSVYAIVAGAPIRASRDSAIWAREVTRVVWERNRFAIAGLVEHEVARMANFATRETYAAIAAGASIGPYANTAIYGTGCGRGATPAIRAVAEPVLGGDSFAVRLENAKPHVLAALLMGREEGSLNLDGCELLVSLADLSVFPGPYTDADGNAEIDLLLPDREDLEGVERKLQWLVQDPDAGDGRWATSPGLTVHLSKFPRP